MAKRIFQDPDKWEDAWHIELSANAKLLLDYLHCVSNRAGFLKWSVTIAAFKTGLTKEDAENALNELTRAMDIAGPRVFFRNGIIYLHDHIFIQDPNGLNVVNTAHGGILKALFSQIDNFPECLVHFPDTHSAMKKTIEEYIKQGGTKIKEAAMKSLLRELNRVEPAKIRPTPQDQLELFPKEVPSLVKECLWQLSRVKGYPYNAETDGTLLMEMLHEYGDRDFLPCLKAKVAWWLDQPLTKSAKPRAQLRNWFHNHFVRFPEKSRIRDQKKEEADKRRSEFARTRRTQQAKGQISQAEKDKEMIIKENEWLDQRLGLENIKEVMKRYETDDREIALRMVNMRRKANDLPPLEDKR